MNILCLLFRFPYASEPSYNFNISELIYWGFFFQLIFAVIQADFCILIQTFIFAEVIIYAQSTGFK